MNIDWHELLIPDVALLELVVRGTVMYFVLLGALRVLVRRHIGSMNLMDLLLLVLIADAAQNAMASDYHSLTEGFVLCGTLIGWNYVLDWLAYRYEWVAAVLEPPPLALVQNGRMQRRNMRQELITEDDLRSQLRQQGIEDIGEIRIAHLEPDGSVSVIKNNARKGDPRSSEGKTHRGGA